MLYFLEKNEKIAAAFGAPPPNPHWLSAAGGSASRPPSCSSHHLLQLLSRSRFHFSRAHVITIEREQK